jgi:acetyl esterase/lipase
MDHEGKQIAQWLNDHGVAAFILRYRHAGTGHQHPAPMMDGQRAIRVVRARSQEWKIDPARIGVLGFSAGGHLASTLGTHFTDENPQAEDPLDRPSSRPDFLVLAYPVISFVADYTHRGSRRNLLGPDADESLVKQFSNELQVTEKTPPTFLFHTSEDTGVPPENSIAFYLALTKAGVPAELHIYERGPHGVGLARDLPGASDWSERLLQWMRVRGLVKSSD